MNLPAASGADQTGSAVRLDASRRLASSRHRDARRSMGFASTAFAASCARAGTGGASPTETFRAVPAARTRKAIPEQERATVAVEGFPKTLEQG
jgi:hypothetical protein